MFRSVWLILNQLFYKKNKGHFGYQYVINLNVTVVTIISKLFVCEIYVFFSHSVFEKQLKNMKNIALQITIQYDLDYQFIY